MIGPVMDEVRMIRPLPDRSRAGRQAVTASMEPFRFVAMTSSTSCSVICRSVRRVKIPVLAHSTSIPPWCSVAATAIRVQSAAWETPAGVNMTSSPDAADVDSRLPPSARPPRPGRL